MEFILFFLILILIIVGATQVIKIVAIFKNAYPGGSIRPFDEAFQKIQNFEVSQRLVSRDYKTALAVDPRITKLCILKRVDDGFKSYVYSYSEILECSVTQDGRALTKVSRTSQVGSALLGGIVAGGAGAIIGGATAKSTTTNIGNINLRLVLNNQELPVATINVHVDTGTDESLDVLNVAQRHKGGDLTGINSPLDLANYWHSIIQVLIRKADQQDQRLSTESPSQEKVVTCPKCKTPIKTTHLYCSSCGEQIHKSCSNCGSTIAMSAKFCTNCGQQQL